MQTACSLVILVLRCGIHCCSCCHELHHAVRYHPLNTYKVLTNLADSLDVQSKVSAEVES